MAAWVAPWMQENVVLRQCGVIREKKQWRITRCAIEQIAHIFVPFSTGGTYQDPKICPGEARVMNFLRSRCLVREKFPQHAGLGE